MEGLGTNIKGSLKIPNTSLKKLYLTNPGGAGRVVFLLEIKAKRFNNNNYKIFIIGNSNHQEIKGTSKVANMEVIGGEEDIEAIDKAQYKNSKVVCLTQTTPHSQ